MRTIRLIAAVSLGLVLVACGKKETVSTDPSNDNTISIDNGMAVNGTVGSDTTNTTAAAAATALPTQKFVDTVAASDMFEIQSGKLAEANGDAADKDIGKMLVNDHTKSSEALKKAAAKASPVVALPTDLPTDLKAKIDALKAAKGADFDKLFAQQQVAGHKEALDVLNAYAASGDQPSLQAWAKAVIPTVQGHLTKLQALPQ